MKIIVQTIDHKEQPYNTPGDWRFENWSGLPMEQKAAMQNIGNNDTVLRINVSNLGDWRYEMLIAVHEIVETLMCLHDGVMVEDVDKFDKAFEDSKQRAAWALSDAQCGNHPVSTEEPGDDPNAPYFKQHCIATAVERLMCAQLGCEWKKYENLCNALPTIPSKE